MDTKIINAENAPAAVGPYCHAVEAGDFGGRTQKNRKAAKAGCQRGTKVPKKQGKGSKILR